MKRNTFTLLEILIAIGVVMILAAITVGGLKMAGGKADEAKTIAVMKEFEMALEKYKADHGIYPVQQAAGVVNLSNWTTFNAGKYFLRQDSGELLDGYDKSLFYQYPSSRNSGKYDLWSMGEDRYHGKRPDDAGYEEEGEIKNAGEAGSDDICNWKQH